MSDMPRRECLGCRHLIEAGSRCPRCDTHAQDYGADHERAKQDPAYLAATHCVVCQRPFTPDNPKTAGHQVAIRRGGRSSGIKPTCQDCNYGWRTTGE